MTILYFSGSSKDSNPFCAIMEHDVPLLRGEAGTLSSRRVEPGNRSYGGAVPYGMQGGAMLLRSTTDPAAPRCVLASIWTQKEVERMACERTGYDPDDDDDDYGYGDAGGDDVDDDDDPDDDDDVDE